MSIAEKYYFDALFDCGSEPPVTYMKNGIRIHKPPFGNEFWGRSAHILSVEFADRETGEITDEFYGSCNDFEKWFVAKAARGDKFDVILHAHNNSPKMYIPYDKVGLRMDCVRTFGLGLGMISQKEDGTWELAPAEWDEVNLTKEW